MKDHSEALRQFKSGKTLRTVGDITFFGGFALGITGFLVDAYDDSNSLSAEIKTTIITSIIGGTMIVATIPLKIIGKQKIRKSVKIYNKDISTLSTKAEPNYQLMAISNSSGIGLRLTF